MDPLSAPSPKTKLILLLLAGVMIGLVVAGLWQWLKTPAADKPLLYSSTIAGTNGEFGEAFGIAAGKGDIYISDGQNGKIWKMHGAEMKVIAEGLDTPSGVAIYADRSIVVADAGANHVLVSKGDDIWSGRFYGSRNNERGFRDGDRTSALFNGPLDVATAVDGRILVADTYNDRIRVIKDDPKDGNVTTIAGSSTGFADGSGLQAKFDTPCGLAVWGDKLLVADTGNHRIRVIEPDGRVWTLAGNDIADLKDGAGVEASFFQPTSIAVTQHEAAYVSDGNAIRRIDLTSFAVTTVTGSGRGLVDGEIKESKFNRPTGLALDKDGSLLIADSENRVVRRLSSKEGPRITREQVLAMRDKPEEFRNAAPPRWPYDPPDASREIAGTLGEVRGEVKPDNDQVWFHNGLDIAGGYGEIARFVREEKVLRPLAVDNFNNLRESIRMPTMGYVHIRLGRDKDNVAFSDPRFQFQKDSKGKIVGLRVPRGTHFNAGDAIGALNAMNHVHLIAGRSGSEMNALDALILPGYSDSRPPAIEKVTIFAGDGTEPLKPPYNLSGKVRVEMTAYDQVDGNADRRRLGVYQAGFQVLRSDLSPVTDIKWSINFARLPDGAAVKFVYANGSMSGATGETVFDYIVSNEVDGDHFGTSYFDASVLENGSYVLRVFAGDQAGNKTFADTKFEVRK